MSHDAQTKYLSTYLPSSILSYVQDVEMRALEAAEEDTGTVTDGQATLSHAVELPIVFKYSTVVLFADVSGYTALCERMAAKEGGDEHLARHLNSYFELLMRAMQAYGGDIFKFAGDALLVVWPDSDESLERTTRRAAQCAIDIKESFQDAVLVDDVRLNVKIGIGCGVIRILHLGGVLNRREYLAVGEPLVQAFNAEHHAKKREVVVSPTAWGLLKDFFEGEMQADGHCFLTRSINPIKRAGIKGATAVMPTIENVSRYIPTAVVKFASQTDDRWIPELRHITVVFVNLGVKESELISISTEEDIHRIHTVLKSVQDAVYKYEGSLNKFLMDDKGSTLVAVFGLFPVAHQDDALRAVLTGLEILASLHELNLRPSIGITTGPAFCGDVGTKNRREYTVLGDTVNLSARMMQHATKTAAGVLCDRATYTAAEQNSSFWHQLKFHLIAEVPVKGKVKPVSMYQPILKTSPPHVLNWRLREEMAGFVQINNQAFKVSDPYKTVDVRGDSELSRTQALTFDIIAAHERGETSKRTILIEAEAGLGKTTLLLATLSRLPSHTHLVFGGGDAFDTTTPLRMWREVLLKLLDTLEENAPRKNPRMYIRRLLREGKCDSSSVAVLNDVFAWNFEETLQTKKMTGRERIATAKTLLERMLTLIAAKFTPSLVVAVEDATYMDPDSWDLCAAISARVPAILLIILTRPMDKTYLLSFMKPVPDSYETLKKSEHTVLLTLRPRSDVLMLTIAKKCYGVTELNPSMSTFLLGKAQGNPYILKAMLRHFVATELIRIEKLVTGDKRIIVMPRVQRAINREERGEKIVQSRGVQTPLPTGVLCLFGARLDRISLPQLMLLKVAAVVGHEFDYAVLETCMSGVGLVKGEGSQDHRGYTVAQLQVAISELVELNILEKTSATAYAFSTRVMRDVIISRMLEAHQTTFFKKICLHSKDHDEGAIDEETLDEKMFADSIIEGTLQKQGAHLRKWKHRYFCLFQDHILYFPHKGDPSKVRVKGKIPLFGDTAVERETKKGTDSGATVFQLVPSLRTGMGEEKSKKLYQLMASGPQIADEWIVAISQVCKTKRKAERKGEKMERQKSLLAVGKGNKGVRFSQIAAVQQDWAKKQVRKLFAESVKEGYLMKRGDARKSWKRRYFILFRDKLMYFEKDDVKLVKGEIQLTGASTVDNETDQPSQTFYVLPTPDGRKYIITALDVLEARVWVQSIQKVIKQQLGSKGQSLVREAKMAAHSVKEGYLQKKGGTLKNWKGRYFVLFNGKLQYFVAKNDDMTGYFLLFRESKAEVMGDQGVFMVCPIPDKKTYELKAQDVELAQEWVASIMEQVALSDVSHS